ncbi:hypothetical protein TNCV_336651 [Trichonephila clavipes]|nr:hypothetical protein TNCV_336651 [Trichonephila clavipes]
MHGSEDTGLRTVYQSRCPKIDCHTLHGSLFAASHFNHAIVEIDYAGSRSDGVGRHLAQRQNTASHL